MKAYINNNQSRIFIVNFPVDANTALKPFFDQGPFHLYLKDPSTCKLPKTVFVSDPYKKIEDYFQKFIVSGKWRQTNLVDYLPNFRNITLADLVLAIGDGYRDEYLELQFIPTNSELVKINDNRVRDDLTLQQDSWTKNARYLVNVIYAEDFIKSQQTMV